MSEKNMSSTQPTNQVTVNIFNGETILHIPKHIIEQFGSVEDGEKLNVSFEKGQLVVLKK